MNDTEAFAQQMEAMYGRLEQLYAHIERSPAHSSELFPSALKELGVAAEELQVASEELHQQNDQMMLTLEEANSRCQYYQDLFNYAPDARLVTNLEGKIEEANLAAARLLNIAQSLLIGKLLVTFVPVQHRAAFRTELNRQQHSRQARTWSVILQSQQEEPLNLILTVAILRHSNHNGNGNSASLHWVLRPTESWAAPPRERYRPLQAIASSKNGLQNGSQAANSADCLVNHPLHTYVRGEVIPLTPQTIWQVQTGLVKLNTFTETNEERLLGLVGPSMPFGTGSTALPVYQATALSEVQLVKISLTEVKASSDLAQVLLLKFNQRIQQVEVLLNIAGQRLVKDRLYLLLHLLKREVGEPTSAGVRLGVRLTHGDIATACCSTRVTITRLLGEFQRENKLAFDEKSHIVLPPTF